MKLPTPVFISIFLISLFSETVNSQENYHFKSQSDAHTKMLMEDLAKMFIASKVVIFKNQSVINAKESDKSSLFGEKYLSQVKGAYSTLFSKPFPELDHRYKKMLVKSMIDVMEDNRTLLTDTDLAFKGLIAATYALQLSYKFSILKQGVKIRFTAPKTLLRNQFNAPDQWEVGIIEQFQDEGWPKNKPIFSADAALDNKPAFRHVTPLYYEGICLSCHGKPSNNPLNQGKPESAWTSTDVSGFPMEGVSLEQLAGGVSISILK